MATNTKRVTVNKPASSEGPAMSPVVIVVAENEAFAEFKAGDKLSTALQVANFFKGRIVQFTDADDKVKAAVRQASPKIICDVLAETDVSGATDDNTANDIYTQAIAGSKWASADVSAVPTVAQVRAAASTGAFASTLGNMVDNTIVKDMDDTINAILKGDAGPTLMALHFRTKFKDVKHNDKPWLASVPPMGSKYLTEGTGRGNSAPVGWALPNVDPKTTNLPIWYGPYDHYTANVKGDDGVDRKENKHFVAEFVAAKLGFGITERLDHIRAAIKGTHADDCPKDILEVMQDVANKDRILKDMAVNTAFQFQKRVRIVSAAFEILQGMAAISTEWPNVAVVLTATTPGFKKQPTLEEQARSKKPFSLEVRTPIEGSPGNFTVGHPGPYAVSVVRGAARKIGNLKLQGNDHPSLADFLSNKRKPAGQTGATPGKTAEAQKKIETIDEFAKSLTADCHYLQGDKTDMLRQRCNDPVRGPEFCALLVRMRDAMQEVVKMEGVTEKAIQFENDLLKSSAPKQDAA